MHIREMRAFVNARHKRAFRPTRAVKALLSRFSMAEATVLWVTYALAAAQSCLAVSERNRGLRREPIPL